MANSTINASKTHCDNGHEFTPENTYRTKEGWRQCRACRNEINRRRKAERRAREQAARAKVAAKRILGLPEDFWRKTRIQCTGYMTPCVIWTGTISSKGYGVLTVEGRQRFAHRFAYEAHYGQIPAGVEPRPVLDHLCRVTACINPSHLELVTDRINVLRGVSFAATNATKTHCIRGHEFSMENTRIDRRTGERVCRECKRIRGRKVTPLPPAVPPPLVEPGPAPDQWDETTREAADADDAYWLDRDWPTEPDDPSDHYYC